MSIKKLFTLFSLFSCLSTSVIAQNAIVGTGFSTGWGGGSCPTTGNSNFTHFTTGGAGGTLFASLTAGGTGNRFFRLGIDWGGTTEQRTITIASDVTVSPGTKYTLNSNCTTNGSMVYNVPNASYTYYFKTLNGGSAPTGTFVFFEIQGTVRAVNSVAQSPTAGNVRDADDITITATLDGAFSAGQAVWLRYTKNGFVNSTVVKMAGSGTSYTTTIPNAFSNQGETVTYYVFTSGDVGSIAAADSDLYTINLNNNGGANYNSGAILNVELSKFAAVPQSNSVLLSWATASETNNSHFDVERSADARTWSKIGEVKGNGSKNAESQYTLVDAQPLAGVNYYRLKQVDTDGKFEYHKIISVLMSGKGSKVTIAPNPAVERLQILGITEGGEASIFNVSGQLLMTVKNTTTLEIGNLPQGVYLLRYIGNNGETSLSRFVKQ